MIPYQKRLDNLFFFVYIKIDYRKALRGQLTQHQTANFDKDCLYG